MKTRIIIAISAAMLCLAACSPKETAAPQLPWLSVEGTQLVNEAGEAVALHGVSLGWHNLWPRFYNEGAIQTLVNDWHAGVIRASMGVGYTEVDYLHRPEEAVKCITTVVDAAIKYGSYVIIDWHSHILFQEEAKTFFTDMATRYQGIPNVIYELFNEPIEDSWEDLKAYAEDITGAIREIEPKALILMGCPHWDQDIHLPAEDPITAYDNIMYTVHFYAATHTQWLRDRTDAAMAAGLPVFVSECAGMEASGNGPISHEGWKEWTDWMRNRQLSWAMWSLSDKDESCSMLWALAPSEGPWEDRDMQEWGRIVRDELK